MISGGFVVQTREESEKLRKEKDGLETERRQITALKKDTKERHIAPLWTQGARCRLGADWDRSMGCNLMIAYLVRLSYLVSIILPISDISLSCHDVFHDVP